MLNFYKILSTTGNIPEDLIGKEIIDIYYDKDYGLCLGIGGVLLAKQREINKSIEDKITEEIINANNLKDLKDLFNSKSILNRRPIKKFPITYEMLWATPKDVLDHIVEVLRTAREANMICDWIDLNKI